MNEIASHQGKPETWQAYEIHMGQTVTSDIAVPHLLDIEVQGKQKTEGTHCSQVWTQ
ncbi:MAG: hypothetical protein AAF959_29515 [Cyanobacteria bacterium P01_D01_bin.56]